MTPPPAPPPALAPVRRRAWAGRALIVSGGAMALALAVLFGWVLGRAPANPAVPEAPTAKETHSAKPEENGEFGVTEDGFVLHPGEQILTDQWFSAGFPHSPAGAVSAAVTVIEEMSTFDPHLLVLAADIYHGVNLSEQEVSEEVFSQRAREIERTMPSGAVFDPATYPSAGAVYRLDPVGVAWEQTTEGIVDVRVLSQDEIHDGRGLAFTRTYIHGRQMRWDPYLRGGDWVVDEVNDPIFEDFYTFDPESYELSNDLWTPLVEPEPVFY